MKNTITITSTATAVTTTTPNTPPRAATAGEDDDPLLSHDSHISHAGTVVYIKSKNGNFFHLLSWIFSRFSNFSLYWLIYLHSITCKGEDGFTETARGQSADVDSDTVHRERLKVRDGVGGGGGEGTT